MVERQGNAKGKQEDIWVEAEQRRKEKNFTGRKKSTAKIKKF